MKNKLLIGAIMVAAAVIVLFITRRSGDLSVSRNSVQTAPSVDSPADASSPAPSSGSSEKGNGIRSGTAILFELPGVHVVWESKTPAAHRARAIEPTAGLLGKEPAFKVGDRLMLPIFEDAVLDAEVSNVTSYPNGAVGMTARLDGKYSGTVYLSSCGGEVRIHADVLGGNDFYVRYDPKLQVHVAIEIDRESSDYQGDCMPCIVPDKRVVSKEHPAAEAEEGAPAPLPSQNPVPVAASDGMSDGVVIDVMIVYTPAALAAEGSTNAINNNIALAMQKSNETHGNSDTKVTLNLVYSGETTYTESGNAGDDLDVLTFTASDDPGYAAMDDVHTLRDAYSADMICLLEDEPGTGGLGWLLSSENGRPDYAYCLARVQQSDWTYTVVHEWGHNMGCAHSETQYTQQGPGLFSYSSGWQWDDAASPYNGYCSVMTYENFDGVGGSEYERIPHFSNPSIDYIGASTNATGDAVHGDNARDIRNLRYVLADYRIPSIPVTAYPCSNSFENAYSPWRFYGGSANWDREDGTDVNLVNNAPNIATTSAADGNFFVMVNGLYAVSYETAILEASFNFQNLTAPEIDFSYCMYSAWGVEVVNTLQASTNNGSTWISLWTNSGESDSAWYQEHIDLSAYAGLTNVQLRFKAETGSTWYKNYACLDNIVVSGAVVENPDLDGDGIPNEWETLYFGGPSNAVATGNPDNDFYNNLEEYIAGLNPTNSDGLYLYNFTAGTNNFFEWNAASGRIYHVYWTDDLLSGFSMLQSDLTTGVFTDTVHSAESEGFYMLEVDLAP